MEPEFSLAHDNKHLTLDERKIIQTGIGNGSSKTDIAYACTKSNAFQSTKDTKSLP